MKTKTLDDVSMLVSSAVETLIETVKQDVELWRQIPFLSMMADGVGGYNSVHGLAYQYGIWEIRSSNNHIVYVDLETGEICDLNNDKKMVLNSQDHTHILAMYLDCLDKFDAQRIAISLRLHSKGTAGRKTSDGKPLDNFRKKAVKKYGLRRMYTRKKAA